MEDDSTPALAPDGLLRIRSDAARPRGRAIFEQGSPGDAAYLVVAGKVKISQHTGSGPSNVLAILGPGEVFGELSPVRRRAQVAFGARGDGGDVARTGSRRPRRASQAQIGGCDVVDPAAGAQASPRERRRDRPRFLRRSDSGRAGAARPRRPVRTRGRRGGLPRPRTHSGRARSARGCSARVGQQGACLVRVSGLDHFTAGSGSHPRRGCPDPASGTRGKERAGRPRPAA